MLTINFDMDGCVVAFESEFQRMVERETGTALGVWDSWTPFGWDRETFEGHFRKAIMNGVFLSAGEVPEAVAAVHACRDAGHRIRFVTSKQIDSYPESVMAKLQTLQWLHHRGLLKPDVEIAFTANKVGYEADVVIDDNPDTSRWAQLGSVNILFDRPWNADVETGKKITWGRPDVVRAKGWTEVIEIIARTDREFTEDRLIFQP